MMKRLLLITLALWSLLGCKKDPITSYTQNTVPGGITRTVYVLNEGMFGHYADSVSARLTLYDYNTKTVYKDIFENANNGQHLGDTGDDMVLAGDRLFILMSNSKAITILHIPDYKLVNTASFQSGSPHDLMYDAVRHRLFFTNFTGNTITVLNDTSLSTVKEIQVGSNPEGLAIRNDKLFVCNSGFGADSTLSVINLNTLSVDTTLVLSMGPTSATVSSDGHIVIACAGNFTVNGSVYAIDPVTLAKTSKIQFSTNLFFNSGSITADTSGNVFVIGTVPNTYTGGPIHKINLAAGLVFLNYCQGVFYGLSVNRYTNELFIADAKNFTGDGVISIINPDGTIKEVFSAQRGPSVFAFRWQ
ncbi:MAG: DUF5074 domain-containing protein [Bacteroidota bacterium]